MSTRTYPQLTVRLPPGTKSDIDLLAFRQRKTQAEILTLAVTAYVKSLPAAERKALETLRALQHGEPR